MQDKECRITIKIEGYSGTRKESMLIAIHEALNDVCNIKSSSSGGTWGSKDLDIKPSDIAEYIVIHKGLDE